MLRTDLSGLVKWSLNSRYAAYFFHWQTNKISQSVNQSNKQTNKRKYKQVNIVLFNVTKILEWAIKCWNRITYFYFFAFYYQCYKM